MQKGINKFSNYMDYLKRNKFTFQMLIDTIDTVDYREKNKIADYRKSICTFLEQPDWRNSTSIIRSKWKDVEHFGEQKRNLLLYSGIKPSCINYIDELLPIRTDLNSENDARDIKGTILASKKYHDEKLGQDRYCYYHESVVRNYYLCYEVAGRQYHVRINDSELQMYNGLEIKEISPIECEKTERSDVVSGAVVKRLIEYMKENKIGFQMK